MSDDEAVRDPLGDVQMMIQAGQKEKAQDMLKALILEMPAGWTPIDRTGEEVVAAFWDMTEFMAYIERHKEVDPHRKLVWRGISYSKALYLTAFLAVERRDWNTALEYLDAGLELEPDHPVLLSEKAMVLGSLKKHGESYELYLKAASSRPWSPITQRGRAIRGAGMQMIDLGRLDEAERILRQSLELEPNSEVAQNELLYIAALRRGDKPDDDYQIR